MIALEYNELYNLSIVTGKQHKGVFGVTINLDGKIRIVVDPSRLSSFSDKEIAQEAREIEEHQKLIDAIQQCLWVLQGDGYGDINVLLFNMAKDQNEVRQLFDYVQLVTTHKPPILEDVIDTIVLAFKFVVSIWEGRENIQHTRSEMSRNYKSIYAQLVERDGGNFCQACHSEEKLTIDHKYPVIRGGDNDLDNLWILCKKCNSRKYNKYDKLFIPEDDYWTTLLGEANE